MERLVKFFIIFLLLFCGVFLFLGNNYDESNNELTAYTVLHINMEPDNHEQITSDRKYSLQYPNYINLSLLHSDDVSRLINLTDFKFLINQKSCSEIKPHAPVILLLIHTGPDYVNRRKLVRDTWAIHNEQIRYLFLLGAVQSAEDQRKIELESDQYKDIIQGNFIDAYRNLTYKHTMALKWFTYYCPTAKFVFKVDDDIFLNTLAATERFSRLSPIVYKDKLICSSMYSIAIREPDCKWYVTVDEYPGEYYPEFCSGFSIVYPAPMAFKTYKAAQESSYFWVDDVFMTGIMRQKTKGTVLDFRNMKKNMSISNIDVAQYLYGGIKPSLTNMNFVFTPSSLNEEQIRQLWQEVLKVASWRKRLPLSRAPNIKIPDFWRTLNKTIS